MNEEEKFFEEYMNAMEEAFKPFYDEKLGLRYFNEYVESLSPEEEDIQRQRAFDLCTKLIDDGMNPYAVVIFINNNFFNPQYTDKLGIPDNVFELLDESD